MAQNSNNAVYWQELREGFNQSLESLGYSKRKLIDYSWALNKIERCILDHGLPGYSIETGDRVLSEIKGQYHKASQRLIRTVVCRLNDYSLGKFNIMHSEIKRAKCPEQFAETLYQYTEYLEKLGRSKSTIKQSIHYCTQLLHYIDSQGVNNLSDVTTVHIYEAFIDSKSNKSCWATFCRGFFKFLRKSKVHATDLSVAIPITRRPQSLPSTYSKSEIEKLLSSIDRSTGLGKRNYAIALLAIRFGMRASDIANLKMVNINFCNKTLSFVQTKTSVPQRFELLPEIESALHCYLTNARPKSSDPSLFLRGVAPFTGIEASAVSTFVGCQFKKAGIPTEGKKHGAHALRMTLATDLISEKVPYTVVGKILGHESDGALKNYVRLDVESLRSCSLAAPIPTGLFAERLLAYKGER
ncbi:tyrosine-type recombinase/integrase [Paenibacillus sp. p3-SID867]|uniref:tyrosine-type recombinase/integrase n=1 Tax=Paenibacillus sp. p3-SID867 TaxID=2916363 RepID=UPI0021A44FA3|nr:tyrosine-type recombinase/integrase [Paenibacillus sp. p3-SID867]MCT1402837.1 tyrosine-type recombinase/integrase [Paenibacillus sp. p3-SID867]